jgi:hypothetical protein
MKSHLNLAPADGSLLFNQLRNATVAMKLQICSPAVRPTDLCLTPALSTLIRTSASKWCSSPNRHDHCGVTSVAPDLR